MCSTLGTHGLGSYHTIALVHCFFYASFINWSPEAWPPGAGVELRARLEERRVTADAAIGALAMLVPVRAGECALGSRLAGHTELLGGELASPLLVGLLDLVRHRENLTNAEC